MCFKPIFCPTLHNLETQFLVCNLLCTRMFILCLLSLAIFIEWRGKRKPFKSTQDALRYENEASNKFNTTVWLFFLPSPSGQGGASGGLGKALPDVNCWSWIERGTTSPWAIRRRNTAGLGVGVRGGVVTPTKIIHDYYDLIQNCLTASFFSSLI